MQQNSRVVLQNSAIFTRMCNRNIPAHYIVTYCHMQSGHDWNEAPKSMNIQYTRHKGQKSGTWIYCKCEEYYRPFNVDISSFPIIMGEHSLAKGLEP